MQLSTWSVLHKFTSVMYNKRNGKITKQANMWDSLFVEIINFKYTEILI